MPTPRQDQFELYDLRVTVVAIESRSVCGLQVGDYFELTESSRLRIPDGKHFCLYALQAVVPLLTAVLAFALAEVVLSKALAVAMPLYSAT